MCSGRMRMGVMLGGFGSMVGGVKTVPMSDMSMMGSGFVVAVLVMLRGFAMVSSGLLVVVSSSLMVFGGLVVHEIPLSWSS